MRSLHAGSLAILLCLGFVPGGRKDAEQKIVPLVIAETGRGRVIEIDRVTGKTTWEISGYRANSVERLPNGNTLISDFTRVVEVNRAKRIVWESPRFATSSWILDATRLPSGNTLICVIDYRWPPTVARVVEIRPWGEVAWSYENVKWPCGAMRLANGNTVIVDNRPWVWEVDRLRKVVWQARLNSGAGMSVQRLPNGNTLIGEGSGIEELNSAGIIVWKKRGTLERVGSVQRLKNGNTLAADPDNNRVVEIDPRGTVVWVKARLGWPWDAQLVESVASELDAPTPSCEAPDPGLFEKQPKGQ